ncbi:hypothetical protein Tco_0771812 [Tanacetum coccineum]|uniref:Uncharacterized protein n=1 Tax=Tanacetum coccineum TaxID=301880 RepID=A0ABQ4ZIR5_9ASTR
MVNWSNHVAENKTGEVEKVYGMMAGLYADNGGADVSDATADDKSSDSNLMHPCDSKPQVQTKTFPPTVDIKTLPESDVEDPNSTAGSP